jgi:radical SAM superfamily enzyme YgiQ (UPF0313 family)
MQESLDQIFDIGVIGEGEETLSELLRVFIREGAWLAPVLKNIKGIIFREREILHYTGPREPVKNIDDLPYPARDLVPMETVYLKDQLNLFGVKRLVSIMTSRGCPYDCVFCGSPVQWGKVRFHSAAYVVDEIQFLTDTYHIDGIMFWDDLFIAPKKRLMELVERIKQKGLDKKLTFFGYARANLIDEEICRLLRSIRVKRLIFGLESGSEKILKFLKGSSVTVEDNARALRLCRAYGITTSSGFITGTPGEDLDDLRKTYNFIIHNRLDNTQIYILTPYPGTAMWEEARRNNLVTQGMDYGSLFVQLPGVRFFDFLKKCSPDLLKGRIFLNVPYKDNNEYVNLIFKMHKLAQARNILFYLKALFFDPGLVIRIITLKLKRVLYARKKDSH